MHQPNEPRRFGQYTVPMYIGERLYLGERAHFVEDRENK